MSSNEFLAGRLPLRSSAVVGLVAVALAGSVFDYLENVMAWTALTAYPDPTAASSLLGLASAGKTIAFWLAGLTLVVALMALAIRVLTRRRANPTP